MDSDVVDINSGVSHKDDPSDWGKTGNLTWDFVHSTKDHLLFSFINNANCCLVFSNENN